MGSQSRRSGLAPWEIREEDYPENGSAAEQLEYLLGYAILAPSSHNTQPWRFAIEGDALALLADRSRLLPIADPAGRELIISCGAALLNLQIAIRYFGCWGRIEEFPDPDAPDLLALVHLAEPVFPSAEERRLFHSIVKRRTHRLPFDPTPLSASLVQALRVAAERHRARFEPVAADAREAVAELVAEADRLLMADEKFRAELAHWLRSSHRDSHDGIPGYAARLPDVLEGMLTPIVAEVVRTFDIGGVQGGWDRELVRQAPLLAVISTPGDTPADWLAAGQALERVLLHARDAGVWASYLNQPIEIPGLRARLRQLLGTPGYPQLLLRLGHGAELKPTPRRSVGEVLEAGSAPVRPALVCTPRSQRGDTKRRSQ